MKNNKNYRQYDKEFKKNAVELALNSGRSIASIARDLGIKSNLIYLWKKNYSEDGNNAFPGKGNLKPEDLLEKQKEKRLRDLEMENAILKKALAIFSKDQK
jgi:transposase